jgi:FixJ family two-component response regulator
MSERRLVAVVDDSPSVRESLPDLLETVGLTVRTFDSAEAFLESGVADTARCLVLDVGLPGMSGPELQQELRRRDQTLPIVFITAQGDPSLKPRLLAAGAAACLVKPFSDVALIDAVEIAIGMR